MNTARIVVLTIALGAGGVAASLAIGSGKSSPAERVEQLQTLDVLVARSDIGLGQTIAPEDLRWQTLPAAPARQDGTRTRRLLGISDINVVENSSDDPASRWGGSVSIARFGAAGSMTIQERPRGLPI